MRLVLSALACTVFAGCATPSPGDGEQRAARATKHCTTGSKICREERRDDRVTTLGADSASGTTARPMPAAR